MAAEKHSCGDDEHPAKKMKIEDPDAIFPAVTNKAEESACVQEEGDALRETQVGISEYLSEAQGFNGVIKQRYSDFLVNEITTDGNIVKLTDLKVDAENMQSADVGVTEADPDVGTLEELLGESLPRIRELHEQQEASAKVHVQVSDDKEMRTRLHQAVKVHFPGLETRTTEVDGVKCIEVTVASHKGRKERQSWDKHRGDYCHCVLYKENADTMQAVNVLTKLLRIPPGKVTYAGTKDRRAKTCQMICFYRIPLERLEQLNHSKQLTNIAVGNFRYSKTSLQLGDLKGNRFTIVLRNVDATRECVERGVRGLQDVGFINYYGMQRFGTTSVPTWHVGRSMIQNKWKEAVDLILKPRKGDNSQMAAAREEWRRSGDAAAALNLIGRRPCNERFLLQGLGKRHQNDLIGALNFIPRNGRLMYLHSYQSYIWNVVTSQRFQSFGTKVQIGDLVLPAATCHQPTGRVDASEKHEEPVVVTEENVQEYSIYDVVLPLPGYAVQLPRNDSAHAYTHLLSKDGLTMNDFKQNIKDYSLPGDYRHVIVKPEGVTWDLHRYDDVTKPLVLSDLEVLKGETLEESPEDGAMLALKLAFSLPSSCYATMALREILKLDTSSAHQSTLNVTAGETETSGKEGTDTAPVEQLVVSTADTTPTQ